MITADQLLLHLIGDYLTQSDWMATEKTKRIEVAMLHAFVYSIPFAAIASLPAYLVIMVSHAIIDRYRLARYLVWAKNFLAPRGYNPPWRNCKDNGYPAERPAWLSFWLLIIADNVIHITINGLAIRYL